MISSCGSSARAGDGPQGQLLHLGELGLGKGRPRKTLGEQGGRVGEILPQRRDAADRRVNRPALIDIWPPIESKYSAICRADVLGGAPVEHGGHQGGAAGRRRVVGQRAAQHERLDVDQRQLGVPLQQHAQAVGKPHPAGFRPRPPWPLSRPASARRPAAR